MPQTTMQDSLERFIEKWWELTFLCLIYQIPLAIPFLFPVTHLLYHPSGSPPITFSMDLAWSEDITLDDTGYSKTGNRVYAPYNNGLVICGGIDSSASNQFQTCEYFDPKSSKRNEVFNVFQLTKLPLFC